MGNHTMSYSTAFTIRTPLLSQISGEVHDESLVTFPESKSKRCGKAGKVTKSEDQDIKNRAEISFLLGF
jgi:hypothetical protein